jgi:hypothetical protein
MESGFGGRSQSRRSARIAVMLRWPQWSLAVRPESDLRSSGVPSLPSRHNGVRPWRPESVWC